jgi:hypothetical protein
MFIDNLYHCKSNYTKTKLGKLQWLCNTDLQPVKIAMVIINNAFKIASKQHTFLYNG